MRGCPLTPTRKTLRQPISGRKVPCQASGVDGVGPLQLDEKLTGERMGREKRRSPQQQGPRLHRRPARSVLEYGKPRAQRPIGRRVIGPGTGRVHPISRREPPKNLLSFPTESSIVKRVLW